MPLLNSSLYSICTGIYMTLKKYQNVIFGYITKQLDAVTINATTQHVHCYVI